MSRAALALAVAALTACTTPAVGLRPAYPPPLGNGPAKLAEPEKSHLWWIGGVDSLRPALEWEVFPRESDATIRDRISNVTYDLRIWRALPASDPVDVVIVDLAYARDGLTSAQHRLDEPLLPSTRYVWTIRARYEIDGMPRATPWSSPLPKARLPIEPNPWGYRFTTPTR